MVPFRVRILVDYRPALRERTGVGEFVHELARALAAPTEPPQRTRSCCSPAPGKTGRLRLCASEMPAARIVDRRIPVRAADVGLEPAGWPPVEWLAGDCDVVHSQSPMLIPARRAARRSSPFTTWIFCSIPNKWRRRFGATIRDWRDRTRRAPMP